MGRPEASPWMRPKPRRRRTSPSRSSTFAASRHLTCTASWSRCARPIAPSWSTRPRFLAGSAPRSRPGSAMRALIFSRPRSRASAEWTLPILLRATRSSISPASTVFSRKPTWPSPMADQTFKLPDLGEGLTEAQLVSWRVEEGAQVEVNAPLCDVETAKAVVVIPSPYAGTVRKLFAQPGESVPVGATLVMIEAASGPSSQGEREGANEGAPSTLVGYGPGGPEA